MQLEDNGSRQWLAGCIADCTWGQEERGTLLEEARAVKS